MLKIQSLASGSKGNCTYIASERTSILVDIGISLRSLLARMKDANINPLSIGAILITHEHSDHIKGVAQFAGRFGCTVYIHKDAEKCFTRVGGINPDFVETFSQPFEVEDINVAAFPLPHDSEYCYGYTFKNKDAKISLATDLGAITPEAMQSMLGSQIVLLESNHDMVRLRANQKYPVWLKKRITSAKGHLSNNECCEGVATLAKAGLQQVILAHLSEENNSPTLAYDCMCEFLRERGLIEGRDIYVDVAEQNKVSIAFQID